MNFLPFKDNLIESILDGSKTSTYRRGLQYDHLQVGEIINIINSETNEVITQATINNKVQLLFQELPLTADNHISYDSREQMREEFNQHYSYINRAIEDDDVFLVFEFQIIS